jgi:two-component system OmpR family response regulator
LVVDDDPDVRELIGEALEEFGILTVAMAAPGAVLEQAAAHRPALIVLDVMMPEGKLYVVTAKSTGKARWVRATDQVRFCPV